MARYFDLKPLLELFRGNLIPRRIFVWEIDKNLDRMTFGQRMRLQDAYATGDIWASTCRELTSIPGWIVPFIRVKKLYPFILHVYTTLEELSKLDAELYIQPSHEELEAGLTKIDNGLFGIIDAVVARVPGVYTHEDVDEIPALRVYKMLKIDRDKVVAQRRLNEAYRSKQDAEVKKIKSKR